jgi:hypothetical protein
MGVCNPDRSPLESTGNERANYPSAAITQSALAEKRRWEVYEGDGVCPVYCGPNAREDALSYARQRAGYAPTEIRILDVEWNLVEAILPQPVRGLV